MGVSNDQILGTLNTYFEEVSPIGRGVWRCAEAFRFKCQLTLEAGPFTVDETRIANVRPAGAVGRNPVVVGMVRHCLTVLQTSAHPHATIPYGYLPSPAEAPSTV
jgi:hypothetical protein